MNSCIYLQDWYGLDMNILGKHRLMEKMIFLLEFFQPIVSPAPLRVIDRDGKEVVSDRRGHCMPTSDKSTVVKAKGRKKENHSLSNSFQDQSPVEHRRRTLIDPDFNAGNSSRNGGGRSRKVEREETEFYIRESTSAPLETPLAPVPAAASNHHARPPSVKAFDVFRPPGYQHPVGSGGSGSSRQYLLNGVNEGIKVEADEPLPVTPDRCQQSPTEDEAVKQMWDEAVRDLR